MSFNTGKDFKYKVIKEITVRLFDMDLTIKKCKGMGLDQIFNKRAHEKGTNIFYLFIAKHGLDISHYTLFDPINTKVINDIFKIMINGIISRNMQENYFTQLDEYLKSEQDEG